MQAAEIASSLALGTERGEHLFALQNMKPAVMDRNSKVLIRAQAMTQEWGFDAKAISAVIQKVRNLMQGLVVPSPPLLLLLLLLFLLLLLLLGRREPLL